jgi:altronate dehydratase large subunit
MKATQFLGYRRADGSVGIRNHIAVISTVLCSAEVGKSIANQVEGAVPLSFWRCDCESEAAMIERDALRNLGVNPNVAAVLVVGLGCEGLDPHQLTDEIGKSGKPAQCVTIQEAGGTIKAMEEGVRTAQAMAQKVSGAKREPVDISYLHIGMKCGGSDATSGIAANPASGVAANRILNAGGTVSFGEFSDLTSLQLLSKRAINDEVAAAIEKLSDKRSAYMRKYSQVHYTLSPGNIEGGLTTIEEKSLGTDVGDLSGCIAGGAQIVVFTSGRGTPVGHAIGSIIKVTGNSETYITLEDNIDINAGTIIGGTETLEDVGERIFNEILAVASGKQTKAEALGFREFQLRTNP